MITFFSVYLSSIFSILIFTFLIQYPIKIVELLVYSLFTTCFIILMNKISK